MKLTILLISSLTLLLLNGCIQHEIIPAPKPVVELECSFSATIDGAGYTLIEDVNGMFCESTKSKEINPSPQPSTATYNAIKKSNSQLDFIQVSLGKLSFNADINADPTLEEFTTFLNVNASPNFSQGAVAGLEIVFRDGAGNVWFSNPNSPTPQNFVFTSLIQESDENGDYMKFNATFNCTMYDNLAAPADSIVVSNAVFKSHFKR